MKKKIAKVLKTMGTALEVSLAGEMLTKEQKKKVMLRHKERVAGKTPVKNKTKD